MAEGKPPPDKRHLFQQHPLSGRGCLGPHDVGRHLTENSVAHIAGHQGNAPQRHYHTDGRHAPVERGFHRRQVVHDAVGIVNDGGEQLEAHGEPQPAAQYRRAQRVDKIFLLDLPVGIAQRFQRADLSALLLHHTGHGGQAHQCRHRQEEDRENGRNVIDSCGIIAKFAHTQCQLLAGIQVPLCR